MKEHNYRASLIWTGYQTDRASDYHSYKRDYTIHIEGKPEIKGSSDPSFHGDKSRHNPEELFVASLSSCHMLWYLHLCSENGITVTNYQDKVEGVMIEEKSGTGYFQTVILRPDVMIREPEKSDLAVELHQQANKMCFIANSCNFKIRHEPTIRSNES